MGVRAKMLELAILGELDQPTHGYELGQRLSLALGPVRRLSFGSLYPALHRLADVGLITVVPGEVAPVKKTARRKTPRRQVIYQITPAGAAYLEQNLDQASVDDESMGLTMRLMSKASAATRLHLLKERRAEVLRRRDANRRAFTSKDSWVRARAELDAEQNEAELSWLDRLIATTGDVAETTAAGSGEQKKTVAGETN